MLNKPDSTRVACLSDEYVMQRNNASSLHIASCLATKRSDQEEHQKSGTSRLLLRCVCVCVYARASDLVTRCPTESLLCSHALVTFSKGFLVSSIHSIPAIIPSIPVLGSNRKHLRIGEHRSQTRTVYSRPLSAPCFRASVRLATAKRFTTCNIDKIESCNPATCSVRILITRS
jgi:hypothetical protein